MIRNEMRRDLFMNVAQTAGLLCRRLPVGRAWPMRRRSDVATPAGRRPAIRQTGGLRYRPVAFWRSVSSPDPRQQPRQQLIDRDAFLFAVVAMADRHRVL